MTAFNAALRHHALRHHALRQPAAVAIAPGAGSRRATASYAMSLDDFDAPPPPPAPTPAPPVVVCSGAIRAHVRAVVERFRPMTTVLAQGEIHSRARIRTLGQV